MADACLQWTIQELMMEFTNFSASMNDGTVSDPVIVMNRCFEIDGKYMEIFNNVPDGWKYQTILNDEDMDYVYKRRYHIYYDYWIAQLWNGMRTVRIMLHEKIRLLLLEGFAMKPPLFTTPEYSLQYQASTDTLHQMQADILASVPQHLGLTPRAPPSIAPWAATRIPQGDDMGTTVMPWTGFNDSNSEQFPVVRASGPYFLLWPLWFAGIISITTPDVRDFVTRNLRFIGNKMGVSRFIVGFPKTRMSSN
jgi:hypothetical protein